MIDFSNLVVSLLTGTVFVPAFFEEADLKYRALKMVLSTDDPNIHYIEKYFSICRDENVINNVRNRVAAYEDSVRHHYKMIEMATYKDSLTNCKLLEIEGKNMP